MATRADTFSRYGDVSVTVTDTSSTRADTVSLQGDLSTTIYRYGHQIRHSQPPMWPFNYYIYIQIWPPEQTLSAAMVTFQLLWLTPRPPEQTHSAAMVTYQLLWPIPPPPEQTLLVSKVTSQLLWQIYTPATYQCRHTASEKLWDDPVRLKGQKVEHSITTTTTPITTTINILTAFHLA